MGNSVSLNPLHASKTLIIFYASWCPHCQELIPKLNSLKKSQKGETLDILAISLDTNKNDWISFVKTKCPDFVNLSDLKGWEGKASIDYSIYATPTMFLVDKDGKIYAKPTSFEEVQNMIQ
jgi:thiol-disulfide isomerase/thioredoxin